LAIGLCFLPGPTASGGTERAGAMSLQFEVTSRAMFLSLLFARDQAGGVRRFRIKPEAGRFGIMR
jgi:hypothetical protein